LYFIFLEIVISLKRFPLKWLKTGGYGDICSLKLQVKRYFSKKLHKTSNILAPRKNKTYLPKVLFYSQEDEKRR
jgi:hypothetical protein